MSQVYGLELRELYEDPDGTEDRMIVFGQDVYRSLRGPEDLRTMLRDVLAGALNRDVMTSERLVEEEAGPQARRYPISMADRQWLMLAGAEQLLRHVSEPLPAFWLALHAVRQELQDTTRRPQVRLERAGVALGELQARWRDWRRGLQHFLRPGHDAEVVPQIHDQLTRDRIRAAVMQLLTDNYQLPNRANPTVAEKLAALDEGLTRLAETIWNNRQEHEHEVLARGHSTQLLAVTIPDQPTDLMRRALGDLGWETPEAILPNASAPTLGIIVRALQRELAIFMACDAPEMHSARHDSLRRMLTLLRRTAGTVPTPQLPRNTVFFGILGVMYVLRNRADTLATTPAAPATLAPRDVSEPSGASELLAQLNRLREVCPAAHAMLWSLHPQSADVGVFLVCWREWRELAGGHTAHSDAEIRACNARKERMEVFWRSGSLPMAQFAEAAACFGALLTAREELFTLTRLARGQARCHNGRYEPEVIDLDVAPCVRQALVLLGVPNAPTWDMGMTHQELSERAATLSILAAGALERWRIIGIQPDPDVDLVARDRQLSLALRSALNIPEEAPQNSWFRWAIGAVYAADLCAYALNS